MRVLITGAAGFLGSHLAERFITEGHDVVGLDNFITGSRENADLLLKLGNFELIEHDISKPIEIPGRLDGILHFASPASPVDYLELPIQTLKVGSLGTHNALGIALLHGARLLMASTSEVYGDPAVHPQTEDYWGNVNPVGFRGVYDEAKRFAEAITMAYHRYHGVDTRIVRIFNTYGPRMRPGDGRVVSNFIVQALRGEPLTIYGDGSQTRSFCYADDEVDGIWRLFNSDRVDPTNIGNPNEFTIRELADVVLEETSSTSVLERLPLPEDDPKVRQPDITVAREVLGWEPKVQLREGIQRTIPYFRELVERDEPVLESPRRVEKPWGHELIWAETDLYVGKILHVKAGHALSLQYHEQKDEVIFLMRGKMLFQAGPSADELVDYHMEEGQRFHVRTGTVHRMVAETDVDILEASTNHLDDVVRLEDRYGRA